MISPLIEFTAGQYQSAFQLAAALNFGLSIFRQLRQPAQADALARASYVLELAKASTAEAVSTMRRLEEAARQKCTEQGKAETELAVYLDHQAHDSATKKMGTLVDLELKVEETSSEVAKKINNWIDSDKFIEWSSLFFFATSLACLGYATAYATENTPTGDASLNHKLFLFLAAINLFPIIYSVLISIYARWSLSNTRKSLRRYERQILRTRFAS